MFTLLSMLDIPTILMNARNNKIQEKYAIMESDFHASNGIGINIINYGYKIKIVLSLAEKEEPLTGKNEDHLISV
ncbi:Hypothetical predicted protein [Octopus vulgaris]|uniref:Uncharacterized protein n=1 Tax=Octopus vulgaris TaxID=6645 RepID=A0AA36ATC1_OCTVU|nr:Hypothetical predicted protein [Octopus vulgaris]